MQEIILRVEGMMCTGCENRIEKALKNQKEVEAVKADHKKGEVQIVVKEEPNLRKIKEKIENLGFRVKEG